MSEWRYRLTVLDLGTRWKLSASFLNQPIYPEGKILRCGPKAILEAER
jgi:hypothetical protein